MKIEGKGKKNFTRVSTIMIRNVDHNMKVTEGGKCAFSHFNRFWFKGCFLPENIFKSTE